MITMSNLRDKYYENCTKGGLLRESGWIGKSFVNLCVWGGIFVAIVVVIYLSKILNILDLFMIGGLVFILTNFAFLYICPNFLTKRWKNTYSEEWQFVKNQLEETSSNVKFFKVKRWYYEYTSLSKKIVEVKESKYIEEQELISIELIDSLIACNEIDKLEVKDKVKGHHYSELSNLAVIVITIILTKISELVPNISASEMLQNPNYVFEGVLLSVLMITFGYFIIKVLMGLNYYFQKKWLYDVEEDELYKCEKYGEFLRNLKLTLEFDIMKTNKENKVSKQKNKKMK